MVQRRFRGKDDRVSCDSLELKSGFGRAVLKFVMMKKADLSSSRFLAGRCTEEDACKGGQKLVRYLLFVPE